MIRGFNVKAEKRLDVVMGNGDAALLNGTEALNVAVFAILVASLLAL